MMRLAMVYDYPFQRSDGRLYTHRSYGHYIDALAPHFAQITAFAPVSAEQARQTLTYALQSRNVDLQPLPFFAEWTGSVPAIVAAGARLLKTRDDWDVLYLRMPCPLALTVVPVARLLRRPTCMHVVGDLRAQMSHYPPPFGMLARSTAMLFDRLTGRVARKALTIAQGEALAKRYARGGPFVYSVIESTVGEGDLWDGRSLAFNRRPRVLYVGALLEKKGVAVLIEAISQIRSHLDVELAIIGAGPAEAALRSLAERRGLTSSVSFLGAVVEDAALRQHFRRADVFVLPSFAEGVPRVLIEAMAQGLPVVATAVGGIPGFVRDRVNGLLVPPGSASSLATAVCDSITDTELRGLLIANSLRTARRYTREAHAIRIRELLDDYLKARFSDSKHPLAGIRAEDSAGKGGGRS